MDTTPIDAEIETATKLCRTIIGEYSALGGKVKYGESYNTVYGELFDFVNFRMETADSCLALIERGNVADALGLTRSLLENYLLLILMCRGTKFFQLRNCENMTPPEFKKFTSDQKAELLKLQADGKTNCLGVEVFPRAKRQIMYIYEGLIDRDDPKIKIPIHYFHFRDFDPMTMRLNEEDYFVYYDSPAEVKKTRKGHQDSVKSTYRFYLSYDALLQCLALNGIADKKAIARIEAHYTFLGQFLHPRHEAARSLHVRSNHYDGKTGVGIDRAYEKSAILLSVLYVLFSVAGIVDEIASCLEVAPKVSIADPGTTEVRTLRTEPDTRFSYFWFIFNDAPSYDRFNHAIHHTSDEQLKKYGGYLGVPSSDIEFDMHIYGHLKSALSGWSNGRVGQYIPPLGALK